MEILKLIFYGNKLNEIKLRSKQYNLCTMYTHHLIYLFH
jgi:hypothetical protein